MPGAEDDVLVGFHGAPDEKALRAASFIGLAHELGLSPPGSARFLVIDREIKRRIAKDAADIALRNVLIGVVAGGLLSGCFALVGMVLGRRQAEPGSAQNPAPSETVGKVQQRDLDKQPNQSAPAVIGAASHPTQLPGPASQVPAGYQDTPPHR